MYTNRQRFLNLFAAHRANLTGVMRWNFNHCPIGAFRLIGQEIKEHTPRTIRDGLAQMSILNHTLNIQIFNVDILKFFNIMVGNLMQKIFTLINYLFIDFRARKLPALAGRGIAHPPLLKDFS